MSHHIVGALYVFTLYYKSMDNVTMNGGFFAQSFYFGLVWKIMPAWVGGGGAASESVLIRMREAPGRIS